MVIIVRDAYMIVDNKRAGSIWDPRLAHLVNRALLAAALLLLLVSLYSFFSATLDHLDHNDFMYAVAPLVWSQGGNLYADVPFVQAPLSIIIPTLLRGAFGTENLFIAARLMSVFLVLGTAVLIAAAFARQSVTIAALFCSLILINPFVLSVAREIGSQSVPLFLLAASVFVATRNAEIVKKAFFISLLIGIATSAKSNQIFSCLSLKVIRR